MKPGTWENIHKFIDFFLPFHYLGKYSKTSCKRIQDCWRVYCCLPCAPDHCLRRFFLIIESTVIFGWAGTAGFSGDFDLDSAELDLSPWRAAASVKKSQSNHRPGLFWVFSPERSLSTDSGSTTLTPLLRSAQAALAALVFAWECWDVKRATIESQNHLLFSECIPYEGLLLPLSRWRPHLINIWKQEAAQ